MINKDLRTHEVTFCSRVAKWPETILCFQFPNSLQARRNRRIKRYSPKTLRSPARRAVVRFARREAWECRGAGGSLAAMGGLFVGHELARALNLRRVFV